MVAHEPERPILTTQQAQRIAGCLFSVLQGKEYTTHILTPLAPSERDVLLEVLEEALLHSDSPLLKTAIACFSEHCTGFQNAWWRLSRSGRVPHILQVVIDSVLNAPL